MKNILVINSSLQGNAGNSTKATQMYIDALGSAAKIAVSEIDLAAIDLPHLNATEMQAWGIDASQRTTEQAALACLSDNFIEQVKQADEIVLGVPMYNFGVPSVLKAFFDRIARAGITFTYGDTGPQGLLTNTKVSVMAARGGKYAGTVLDTQSDYITHFFNFLGLQDIDFYYIEGLAMGEDMAKTAWENFSEKISELK